MTSVQVLLQARTAAARELVGSAATLLTQVPTLEVVCDTEEQFGILADRFAERVLPARELRPEQDVLVVSGRVALAVGAVQRLVADVAETGRSATRVLVPGLTIEDQVTCWSREWLQTYAGSVDELVGAGLGFDRQRMPLDSPLARRWVRADQVGAVAVDSLTEDPLRWARRVGRELAVERAVRAARLPAGAARRTVSRWSQRRQHQTVR